MTDYQQEILKIVLDKALLGLIAMGFGFYLSRLLEKFRAKKSYELFVWQQRIDACRQASKILTDHYYDLIALYDLIEKVFEKHPETLSDEEAKPAYEFIENYKRFERELKSLTPFFTTKIVDAIGNYLDKSGEVTNIIKDESKSSLPQKEELRWAFAELSHALGSVIAYGPYDNEQIHPNNKS